MYGCAPEPGAAPRFGSSYLRLQPEVLQRATFCYPDSVFEPQHFGTVDHALHLIALAARGDQPDPLDDYIEAHVHGPVLLARDVQALVLDPSFRGGAVEALACRLPCAVEWHLGSCLEVDALRQHPDYRGAEIIALGLQIARHGVLTPATIGGAQASEPGRRRLENADRQPPQDRSRISATFSITCALAAGPAANR